MDSLPLFLSFSLLGLSGREERLEVNDSGTKTIIPGVKPPSGQVAEKDPPPMVGPDVDADTMEEKGGQNIPMMPKPPIKVRLACFPSVISHHLTF